MMFPSASRRTWVGLRPRKVLVSIGSRKGSIEGFVT